MSKVNVLSLEKAKIYPVNSQSTYSFFKSNPQMNFEISPQMDKMLDTSTIRLNFDFKVLTSAGAFPTLAQDVNIDSRIGVSSVIESIRIRQQNTNEVIEENLSYGSMCSAIQPSHLSFNDYKTNVGLNYGASGKDYAQRQLLLKVIPCSLVLKNGLFRVGLLNLKALGGLSIEVNLNSNSQVLHGADASLFHYDLENVNMSFNYVETTPNLGNNLTVAYPVYTSFNSIVSSSNDQISLLFNQQSVRSVFSISVLSNNLNNFEKNGFTTNRLQDAGEVSKKVLELVSYKDGVKFPRDYIVNERDAVSNGSYECFKNRLFLECFKSFNLINNCIQSPHTQGTKTHVDSDNGYDVPDNRAYTGVNGTNYDALRIGESVPYVGSMYSMKINSELNSGDPNNVFTFTLSNKVVKTNPNNVELMA